jgi:hypothetical protein
LCLLDLRCRRCRVDRLVLKGGVFEHRNHLLSDVVVLLVIDWICASMRGIGRVVAPQRGGRDPGQGLQPKRAKRRVDRLVCRRQLQERVLVGASAPRAALRLRVNVSNSTKPRRPDAVRPGPTKPSRL